MVPRPSSAEISLRSAAVTAGFDWPDDVMESRGPDTRPGESTAILFTWQAQRLWTFVQEDVRNAAIDALEHVVSGDPSARPIARALLRSNSLIAPDATLASLPALNRGAQQLSVEGRDTGSVSTTSLAVGEELLTAGFDRRQACLTEETIAWLGAAIWALCTSREEGRRYIASWGASGPAWQQIEDPGEADIFLFCAYLNDVPFLMNCPELVPYLPTTAGRWYWAGEEQIDRMMEKLPEPADRVPSVSLEDLAGMHGVREIDVTSQIRFVIGPVRRRGKDFVVTALISGKTGVMMLEMGLEQRAGRLWPHLENPPIHYGTKGRESDLQRTEARLERLFTERLVAASRAAHSDGEMRSPQMQPHRAATTAASMFIS